MKVVEKIKLMAKKYGLAAITFLASSFGVSAHANNRGEDNGSNKDRVSITATSRKNVDLDSIIIHLDTMKHKIDTLKQVQTNDSVVVKTDTVSNDTVFSDTVFNDTILVDSVALERYRIDKFHNASDDMVKFLSLFEDIKPRAYWDRVSKRYSIGLGFCYRKDGSRIRAGDYIKDEKDFFDMWEYYATEKYLPHIQKYFKLENLTDEEMIAITSLMFNCGPGIVGHTNYYSPTSFTKSFNKWKETGDEKYLNLACQYIKARNKSKGRVVSALTKRRRIEEELIRGNISVNEEEAKSKGVPFLNLNEVVVGAFYSIGKLPNDIELLMDKVNDVSGRTYSDTLRIAFSRVPPIKTRVRSR